jgi:hypothetical protein
MEIKVITERESTKFETEVNKFIGETSRVITQIQFSTAQYAEGEVIYAAFIILQ